MDLLSLFLFIALATIALILFWMITSIQREITGKPEARRKQKRRGNNHESNY